MKIKVLALILALLMVAAPTLQTMTGVGFASAYAEGADADTEETPAPDPSVTPEAVEEQAPATAPEDPPTPTPQPDAPTIDTTKNATFSPAFVRGWVEIAQDAALLVNPGDTAYATVSGGAGYALFRQNQRDANDCLWVAFAANDGVQTAYIPAKELRPMSVGEVDAHLALCARSSGVLRYENDPALPLLTLTVAPSAEGMSAEMRWNNAAPMAVTTNQSFMKEVVRLVNVERSKQKLPPLSGDLVELNDAALVRAKELARMPLLSHLRPNGDPYWTVLDEYGFCTSYAYHGENCARGSNFGTPAAVVAGWMGSPGHRAAILNPNFRFIGVGYAYDASTPSKNFWVQLFTEFSVKATAIEISPPSLRLTVGKTATLTAQLTPSHSIDPVQWSNTPYTSPLAATVDQETGEVRALAIGTTVLRVDTVVPDYLTAYCTVEVVEPVPATDIRFMLDGQAIYQGTTAGIPYMLTPRDSTDDIAWSSSDTSIATVNATTGEVRGVKAGSVVITATAESGVSATYGVMVVLPYDPVDVAVINRIIKDNGLNWTPAPADGSSVPAGWAGVTWHPPTYPFLRPRRIKSLDVTGKNLTGTLDLSGLDVLAGLSCGKNKLRALEISDCTELAYLDCSDNQLAELDISGFDGLYPADTEVNFICANNPLTHLHLRDGALHTAVSPANGGVVTLAECVLGNAGHQIKLTATANKNFAFDEWTSDELALAPSGATIAFTLPASETVTATAHFLATGARISLLAIPGVTPPLRGKIPAVLVTPTAQYTGAIAWQEETGPDDWADMTDGVFQAGATYRAIITLAAKTGFSFVGLAANSFNVAGARKVTHAANRGIVTAVFPATAPEDITITEAVIPGVTAPVAGEIPVSNIAHSQYTGKVTWSPAFSGVFAGKTEYTATITLREQPGFTLAGVGAGFFSVEGAATTLPNEPGSGALSAVFPATDFALATDVAVSPLYTVLRPGDTAEFTAALLPAGAEAFGKIVWSLSDPDALEFVGGNTGQHVTVQMKAAPTQAKRVHITAVYYDRYRAIATVELMPLAAEPGSQTVVRLMESKITVNKAKTAGVLVPVVITQETDGTVTGTVGIQAVKLFTQNRLTKEWSVPLAGFEAAPNGRDIEIRVDLAAVPAAKSTSGVKAAVLPLGEADVPVNWIESEGTVSLTVVEKYPKITVTAGALNCFYPDSAAQITATAADGSRVDVTGIAYANAAAAAIVTIDGLALKPLKAGSAALTATLDLHGYVSPYARGVTTARVTARVVNTAPKLKLSAASVALVDTSTPVDIMLLTADAKVAFQTGYTVANVERSAVDAKGKPVAYQGVDVYYEGDGVIRITPQAGFKAGIAMLKVTLAESGAPPIYLPLGVTVVAPDKLAASVKTKAVIVSKDYGVGPAISLPITVNAANHVLDDWYVVSVNSGQPFEGALAGAIGVRPGKNQMTLWVEDQGLLASLVASNNNRDAKFVLNIGSDSLLDARTGKPKTFAVTLTIAAKAPAFTVALKGKIDVASPVSAITATAKFVNTASALQTVALYNPPNESVRNESADFKTNVTGPNIFTIMAQRKDIVPGAKQSLSAASTLVNGETLNSWEIAAKEQLLAITPAQTVGRATQSTKEITLYRAMPYAGQAIGLNLITPAGVQLGEARLHEASIAALKFAEGGFELVRSGQNNWFIRFADGALPTFRDARGNPVPLRASYTIKLELWAEGTYKLQDDGEGNLAPVALESGKAKSKPTMVNVKINIK